MEKQYPQLFNQNDYGAVDLGTSTTETIAAGGCFDSSLAMKACFYGHKIDPVELNQLFVQKGVYVETDLLPDNGLAQVFPDIKYIKTLDYEPIPTDLNTIKTLLSDPSTTVTLRIGLGGGNYHFVEAVACDGTALHIANPLSGKIEDFSQRYGSPVTAALHVIVYTGPVPTQPQVAQIQPDPTASTPLAQRFTQAITKANNFDEVADFLGIAAIDRVAITGGQQVIDKIKFLQEEIETFHATPPAPTVPPALVTAPILADPSIPPQKPPVFSDGTNPTSGKTIPVVSSTQGTTNGLVYQPSGDGLRSFFVSLFHTLFL